MKSETFLRAVGWIDDDLVMEAEERPVRRVRAWLRPAGMAAACLLCVIGIAAAGPLLWRTGSDSASAEFAPAEGGNAKGELYDGEIPGSTAASAPSCAEDDRYATADTVPQTEPALDTDAGVVVTGHTFWFCENGEWRSERREYPGGLPGMQTLLNDYLAAAGTDVRCTAVSRDVAGEKDEVIGDLVMHTVGVTTWTVTLDGDPGADIRRGLTNTTLNSAVPSSLYQVVIRTPDTEYEPHGAYSVG